MAKHAQARRRLEIQKRRLWLIHRCESIHSQMMKRLRRPTGANYADRCNLREQWTRAIEELDTLTAKMAYRQY